MTYITRIANKRILAKYFLYSLQINYLHWKLSASRSIFSCYATFIGSNYFCESRNSGNPWSHVLYTSNPLWDCQSYEVPCTGFPWFHRDYGTNTTTDSIVLRVCGDEDGEESPVSFLDSNNNFLTLEV